MALTPSEKMAKLRKSKPKLRINPIEFDPSDPIQQKIYLSWQAETDKKQLFMKMYIEHLARKHAAS